MAKNGSRSRHAGSGRVTPKQPAPSGSRTNWVAIAVAGLIILGLIAGIVGALVGASTQF